MSNDKGSNKATMLFDGPLDVDYIALVHELQRVFDNISLEFEQIAVADGSHAIFTNDTMVLRIGYRPDCDWPATLRGYARPVRPLVSTAMTDALLGDVRHALEITVDGAPGAPDLRIPEAARNAACYHAVRHLLRRYQACLVHWALSDTIFTAEEFETPAAMPARIPRSRPAPLQIASRTGKAALLANPESGGRPDVEATHLRLDQHFAHAVQARQDGQALHRVEFSETSRVEPWLHRMMRRLTAPGPRTAGVARQRSQGQQAGLLEQISVYVMTLTIMVLAFPAGLAMLVYTVLRGENLTATARVMALTGLGAGVLSGPLPQTLQTLI